MRNLFEDYKKYRWFFTVSGKLVIGGKSSEQNEELLKKIKQKSNDFVVMHTNDPGSPFTVILSERSEVTERDLEECAIFTACFSRAWRLGKKKSKVDIFRASDLYKEKNMKQGTWGVFGKVMQKEAVLKLILTKQKGLLRAVPKLNSKKEDPEIIELKPGKIEKIDLAKNIKAKLGIELDEVELLSAVPSGRFSFTK